MSMPANASHARKRKPVFIIKLRMIADGSGSEGREQMIRVLMEIRGAQTEKHCSMTSSIGACEKLNVSTGRCLQYKCKLTYDWDAHAFNRANECIKDERND